MDKVEWGAGNAGGTGGNLWNASSAAARLGKLQGGR